MAELQQRIGTFRSVHSDISCCWIYVVLNFFSVPLDEATVSGAVIVILSGSDEQTETLSEQAK